MFVSLGILDVLYINLSGFVCSDVVVFKMTDEDRHVLVDHQEENEDGDGQDTVVSSRHRRYS